MKNRSRQLRINLPRTIKIVKRVLTRKPALGICTVCGRKTLFLDMALIPRESYKCLICRSISRNRHVAKIMCELFKVPKPYSLKAFVAQNPGLSIFEAQARGPIHDQLRGMPNYICSEYLPNVPRGRCSAEGVRSEDLQALTFQDRSHDLVITQDVFEHIRDVPAAMNEIHRILKPDGIHLWTVPIEKEHPTVRRIIVEGATERDVLPRVYHSDSVRDGLVYTEFGNDVTDYVDPIRFATDLHWCTELDAQAHSIYWSCVLVSRKR